MHVTVAAATETAQAALRAVGASEHAAKLQADLLVDAELRGLASHGMLRLPRILDRIANGVADPVTTGRHRWTGAALLTVDGRNGLGPVVASAALDAVSARARTTGVACAAVHASNHLGALAWYVRRIAFEGQVCIALTTSEAIMHPFGGRTALVGSNPIAIGVPAQPRPFVFDMASTAVSMGKVHDYANRGEPLEPGWALDHDGEPTVDAVAAKDGAIAPFGGAKGYGLGLAIEVLVAALTGTDLGSEVAGTLDSDQRSTKGDVFIVAEPQSGGALAAVSSYLEEVRQSPPARPDAPVAVPGDRSERRRAVAVTDGFEIPDDIWQDLCHRSRQP